jgi:TPR repeat protein
MVAAHIKPDALYRLADSLSEDVLNTPAERLLAEAAEDDRHPGALVREFDAILNRGAKRAAGHQLMDRLRRIGRALSLPRAAFASAPIAAVAIAFIAGAYYREESFRSQAPVQPITVAASNESLKQAPAAAVESKVIGPKLAAQTMAALPEPAPPLSHTEAATDRLSAAAMQGQRNAQASLGIMLVEGRGVPRDVARGLSWLMLANDAAGPNEVWIKEAYANAYVHASESERKAAQGYAGAWLEHHPIASTR